METFLDKLVQDLLQKHEDEISSLCIVFPTRRAGLYFKKRFASRLETPAWAPAVFSIEDFVQSLSSYRIGDDLDLIFDLYSIYKKYFPDEPFDKFYPWGAMLLRDFDETDSALADASRLFATIAEIKFIDEQFGLADEDIERIREFWKLFFDKDQGRIRKAFQDSWQHLGSIYSEFTALARKNNRVTKGMAERAVAEGLKNNSVSSAFGQHVFAGFYSLSRAEESIIRHFLQEKTGSIYFDADAYYTDDLRQEAGRFIRKNSLAGAGYSWKENLLATSEKKIEMIGVPLQVVQAKTAGQIISGLPHEADVLNRTAIVLPDEQLLLPVLYSLPSHIEDVNVTMGYPLSASPLFNLIESLFSLQRSSRKETYYFKEVISLLSHPHIRFADPAGTDKWLENFRNHPRIRIPKSELNSKGVPAFFSIIFSGFNSLPEALEYFNRFFLLLVDTIRANRKGIQAIEKEYVYYFFTRFKKLEEVLGKVEEKVSIETFRSLFKEVIRLARIPFTGEPLKGLQVMGFLETRVLDFENVIILSLNEDVLPPTSHHPSFIPYSIRKAFGLPTFDDNNAVSSYHFYRLLQRAKNIYLVYNTEVKNFSGGEKSRFLLQVENELVKRNPSITLVHRTVPVGVEVIKTTPVLVEKTPEVMKELEKYFQPLTEPLKYAKKLSASALGSYIACPLRFYFQYVAKLKQPDDQDEFIEGGLLGTILHEAMHSLYKSLQHITSADFDRLHSLAERAVEEAIRKEFSGPEALEGKNVLMRNVLIELVRKILDFDRKSLPSIRHLEKEFVMPVAIREDKKVHLYGIIDRVDFTDGVLRVVDYKTGAPDKKKAKDIASLFQFPEHKEQFQAFFYSMLLKNIDGNAPVKAGLFRLRRLREGISYVNDGRIITDDQFNEFLEHTKKLLLEMFNPAIPFVQVQDETRCTYCAYRDICSR